MWRLIIAAWSPFLAVANNPTVVGIIAQGGEVVGGLPDWIGDIARTSPFAAGVLWLYWDMRKVNREQSQRYDQLQQRYDQLQEKRIAEAQETLPLLSHAVQTMQGQGNATRALVEQPLLPGDVVKELRRLGRVLDDIEGGR